MRYLFARFSGVEKLLDGKFLLLLLDCDGTLAPIASTPKRAFVPQETKVLLRRLSKNKHCKLGIISGRALRDIKRVIGLRGIIYAGNHGLEIESPGRKFKNTISPRLRHVMRKIAADIKKRLGGVRGVLIEDKGLSLSLHYRLMNKSNMPALRRIISETTAAYIRRNEIKIGCGKKVFEIKPPVDWDKGKAALWIMEREQAAPGKEVLLPIFIGDDTTDEDAFKVVKKRGLAVFVGKPGNSAADYYLKSTREVTRFLRLISNLRWSGPCRN